MQFGAVSEGSKGEVDEFRLEQDVECDDLDEEQSHYIGSLQILVSAKVSYLRGNATYIELLGSMEFPEAAEASVLAYCIYYFN